MKETITISDHDNNTIVAKLSDVPMTLCKRCLVCDEAIELSEAEQARMRHGLFIEPGICDNCKNTILRMRRFMEGN